MEFFTRLKARCIWSWEGCVDTWRAEPSFRQWVWVNIISVSLAFLLPLEPGERALILVLGLLVLVAELFNSSIEATVDLVSPDVHPLAKRAKDAASAGVALTAIAGGVAWLVILIG